MDLYSLIAVVTLAEIQAQLLGFATGAGLKVTSWARGETAQQMLAIFSRALEILYAVQRQIGLGLFLDTSTDPGDDDDLAEAPGQLSALGEGTFGTPRAGSAYASGGYTWTNSSGQPITVAPEELYLQHKVTFKGYRNTYDESLYAGPGRLMTVANGATVTFPIKALEPGTASNAAPGDIEMVSAYAGTTGTNAASVLGQDRISAAAYRELCRRQAAALSPAGAQGAYEWLALNLNTDGTIAETDDGKTRLNVSRVRVRSESTYGTVTVWAASPSGPVDAGEFTTLEAALTQYALPNGQTLDAVNCTNQVLNIVYTAKTTSSDTSVVEDAVEDALVAWFPTLKISGYNFDGVSGVLLVDTIKLQIGRADPSLYDVDVTEINGVAAADVVLAAGKTAALGTLTATITVES